MGETGAKLRIRVVATGLPGRVCGPSRGVRVGLQVGKDIVAAVDGDAPGASWETEARVVDGNIRGKAIHGPRDERFLYLAWTERGPDGMDTMFRRAKLQLDAVPAAVVEQALRTGQTLLAELTLTDGKGMPVCASVRPPCMRWRLED